jgi:ketosteroid isomerase-like protein
MSRENVEVVRRFYDSLREAAEPDTVLASLSELLDARFEFDISRTNPEGRVYHGRDGLRDAMEQWLAPWDDYRLEAVEFLDAGDERVVVMQRERGRIRGTGAWVEHQRGVVYTVRNGKITRYEEHHDRAQALEAVGLRE